MKLIKIFAVLSLFFMVNPSIAQDEQAQKVHSIIYIRKSFDWYVQQYKLWEKELAKNKKDPTVWLNIYTAARMAKITSPDDEKRDYWTKESSEVIKTMDKYISGTYEYWILKEWQGFTEIADTDDPNKLKQGRKKMHGYALKAYELNPDRWEVYSGLLNTYIEEDNKTKSKEISTRWLASGNLTYSLLALNYNMLASTSDNAILFTQGDNDTYPAWVLQNGKDFRNDVTVINIWMVHANREYRNIIFAKANIPIMNEKPENKQEIIDHVLANRDDKDVYFTPGFAINSYDSLAENVYNVGAALVYSEDYFNNISFLVANFEQNFLLDQIQYAMQYESWPEKAKEANFNYVSGLFHLLEHYTITDQGKKVVETKNMIMNIVSETKYEEEIKLSLSKY